MPISSKKPTKEFVTAEASKITEENLDEALNRANEINEKLVKFDPGILDPKTVNRYTNRLKLVLLLLNDYKEQLYKCEWIALSSFIYAVLYFINPSDIVPDAFYPVGYNDDTSVMDIVFIEFEKELKEYIKWKKLPLEDYF